MSVLVAVDESISYALNVPRLEKNSAGTYYATGNTLSIDEFYPELLGSDGDALAMSLANYRSIGYFNNEINRRAKSLGLKDSTLEFSSTSYQSATTLNDLFQIARHFYFQKPFLFEASNHFITKGNVTTFTEKNSSGETGFAYLQIGDDSTTPIIITLRNSQDFLGDIEIIKQQLTAQR